MEQTRSKKSFARFAFILKRIFDIALATICAFFLFPLISILALLVLVSSGSPVIHWSNRIGKNDKPFLMPKFRTMSLNTPLVATHMLENPEQWVTPLGRWLRKTSLDELPQLWSIFCGEMSFVGPRPALFSQHDLIQKRRTLGISHFRPGLTGLAQVNGRDELKLSEKISLDLKYVRRWSLALDVMILFQTLKKVFVDKTVSH